MASSTSTDLKLELITTGEKSGTWGTITNTNLQILEQAAQWLFITCSRSADVALSLSKLMQQQMVKIYIKINRNSNCN